MLAMNNNVFSNVQIDTLIYFPFFVIKCGTFGYLHFHIAEFAFFYVIPKLFNWRRFGTIKYTSNYRTTPRCNCNELVDADSDTMILLYIIDKIQFPCTILHGIYPN